MIMQCFFFFTYDNENVVKMCYDNNITTFGEFVVKYDPNVFSSDFTQRITYEQNKLKMPYFFRYHINTLSLKQYYITDSSGQQCVTLWGYAL